MSPHREACLSCSTWWYELQILGECFGWCWTGNRRQEQVPEEEVHRKWIVLVCRIATCPPASLLWKEEF